MKPIPLEIILGLYEAKILESYERHDIKDNDKLLSKHEVDEIAKNYPHFPLELLAKFNNREGKEVYIMPVIYGSAQACCEKYNNFNENNEYLKKLSAELLKYCEGHLAGKDSKELKEYMSNAFYYKYAIIMGNKYGDKINLLSPQLQYMKYNVTGRLNNKANVTHYANLLVDTIENEEDLKLITQYYDTITNTYDTYNQREWSFRIWSKALKNIIKDNKTFSILPNFLINRYQNATNEIDKTECIKALEKIDFPLIKSYMEDLFKKSKNHKHVLIAKTLLEKNNVIKNKDINIENINLIEQKDHFTLYQTVLTIKTDYLLTKVNNNNKLMPELIEQHIIKYLLNNCNNNIHDIQLTWSKDNEVLTIILETKNEHYHEQFKKDLNELLKLVFSEEFVRQYNSQAKTNVMQNFFDKLILKMKLERNTDNKKNSRVEKKTKI